MERVLTSLVAEESFSNTMTFELRLEGGTRKQPVKIYQNNTEKAERRRTKSLNRIGLVYSEVSKEASVAEA